MDRPALLIYGGHDWSGAEERGASRRAILGVTMDVIEDVGHFASLDAPDELEWAVTDTAADRGR
jgi:pimeloyl-ACP methyl ester carboxylesterase